MALTLLTLLPFLMAGTDLAAQCPGDRPIVSEGSCVGEMDAYVSCIRRTAGERSDLSTSEKSDLEGRVQSEVERLVKVKASIEGVRKVEKNVVSSYSRSGHPGAEVEIAKACLRMATPKRAKRSADTKGAPNSSDRSDLRLRDNYGQINGEGSHDNSQIVQGADKEEVARLKEQLETMKEYSEYAKLTPTGVEVEALPPIVQSGPIPDSMRPGITMSDNRYNIRCEPDAIVAFRRTAAAFPKFPWSFYALANCLLQASDETWRGYARTAIQIFEKTTTIPGHNAGHDTALTNLQRWNP
jgi:hypothetical protein